MNRIIISNSPALSLPAKEFASQGNAVLGIRDSGKSYTATYLAEQLLESEIPFVAFDPVGIWKNLKFGRSGKKGYPVVVAGEGADIELTPQSAPRIVHAAMVENIPLVLDLYSMNLSKADWKKIVEESVRLLLYENKRHGLRHVFIEEAAEFAPQRVGPDQGRVYAEIEKLARMGGNASLGYTLINQRAEEVNKAVLELCDCLFLHRQKGRHSITALSKWLNIAGVEGELKGLVKSLPMLEQGECWVWLQGSQEPVRVRIPEKQTVHPDRRNPLVTSKAIAADVTGFVGRITKAIAAATPRVAHSKSEFKRLSALGANVSPPKHDEEIREWEDAQMANAASERRIEELETELREERRKTLVLQTKLDRVRKHLKDDYDTLRTIFEELAPEEGNGPVDAAHWEPWLAKLKGKNRKMLEVLIERKRLTRQQLAFHSALSHGSGTFSDYLSRLNSLGLIRKEGDHIALAEVGA